MTTKIAHIADTHLGYRQYGLLEREEDFYDTFKIMIDDMIDKKVDYVLHCGDLFDQPKPPIKALLVAQECFMKLIDHGIDIYVIAGNHDILQKRNTSIPQELYENDHFHIITLKNDHYIIEEDIFIGGMPFLSKNYEEITKGILNDLAQAARGHKHKILMLHGGIPKYFDFNCEFELDTIPKGFDYYALGHIHQRILEKDFKNGILSYPGCIDIKDKGEISEYKKNGKGYNLLTIDEDINVEFIDFKLKRKFINKEIKYYQLDEELAKIEENIQNEILITEDTKKPILILNIVEGNFNRTDVSARIYEQFEDLTLSIRLSFEPTILDDTNKPIPDINDLNPRSMLEIKLKEKYSEGVDEEYGKEISTLGVGLYDNLIQQNLEEAVRISKDYYNKHYGLEDENNDN